MMKIEYKIGDCLELIKEIPDASIDLVVTSPPYFNSAKKYQRGIGVHYSKDIGEPLYIIVDCAKELVPKVKQDGLFCLNLGFSYAETGVMRPFYITDRIQRDTNWFVVDVIIWHKNNPIPMRGRLTNAFEYIFVLAKHPLTRYKREVNYEHNVWQFPVAQGIAGHSAIFPVELPKRCIELMTKEGDTVLDPFLGSGTTLVACKITNRNGIGFETNPEYETIIKRRCQISTPQLEAF